jgi:hypothetical protein
MRPNRGHRVGGALIVAALLASPLLMDCGKKGMGGIPGEDKLPGGGAMPGSCPANIADANALMEANFGLKGELEGKVKAALAAGADLQKIAGDVEAEVTMACGNLAKDLGASDADLKPKEEGPGKKAEAACQAAVRFVGEVKAKAKGSIKVEVKPPRCAASMDAVADCAGKCDATVKPGSAKVECEGGKISGECSGKCDGECDVQAGAKCEGSCNGECDGECSADISGKCDGTCDGKCDGKDTHGKCAGSCDGKCKGQAKANCSGTCKGSCSATCTVQAKGECKGECSGSCNVEMKEPKCSGEVKPPQMSAECKAHCNASVKAKLECKPASVVVKVEGSADAQASLKLKTALVKDLPAILKVSMGMKGQLASVVGEVKSSLEGAEAAVKGGGDAMLKVGGCFAGSLKAQADASVSLDVSVKASASASASAGAG